MKPTEDRDRPAPRGFLGRFRELPGSRTAVVAFVLTVVLGIGGTAAYALWSQTGNASISVVAGAAKPTPPPTTPPPTTPPTTPPPTSPPPTTPTTPAPTPGGPTAIAPNVQTAWAGRPAGFQCTRVQTDSGSKTIGIKISWAALSTATSYVVSVKSLNANYTYTQPAQEVTSSDATFIFPENKGTPSADFYTNYLVRVMPMAGAVGGDSTYRIFQHRPDESSNCYDTNNQETTAAMPLPRTVLSCSLPGLNNTSPSVDVPLQWTSVTGATSYRISVRPFPGSGNKSNYGADIVSTGTSAAFRYDIASQAGLYLVRVQPMNGRTAGDPTYIVYQLDGPWSHHCRPQPGAAFQ